MVYLLSVFVTVGVIEPIVDALTPTTQAELATVTVTTGAEIVSALAALVVITQSKLKDCPDWMVDALLGSTARLKDVTRSGGMSAYARPDPPVADATMATAAAAKATTRLCNPENEDMPILLWADLCLSILTQLSVLGVFARKVV